MVKCFRYEKHPYIIYTKVPYVTGTTKVGKYITNNHGFCKVDDTQTNPTKKRIICVGGSTTEMAVGDDPENTYPGWLEKYLGNEYEVLNAGCSSYTTAEILINFELRLIDFKPEYVVFYAAINDVWFAAMIDSFKSDYSHSRENRGFDTFSERRRSIIYHIAKEGMGITSCVPDKANETFRRNIKSFCGIAKVHGIEPVIVKFKYNPCIETGKIPLLDYFNMSGLEDIFLAELKKNIDSLKSVADEIGCRYVDPGEVCESDFIDSCHLSTEGMKKIAKSVAGVIK